MPATQYAQLAETILLNALNGGTLAGEVFRHSDTGQTSVSKRIAVKGGQEEPQLDGPRGRRVEVEIEICAKTPGENAARLGEAMARILSGAILLAAALAAGLTADDDFYLLDEEISGDRGETKNLRKRTITVPMILRVNTSQETADSTQTADSDLLTADAG